jgi:hypothetical protein
MDAHGIEVQYGAGTREKEQRLCIGRTAAQPRDQGFLGRVIQTLFQHVDDRDGRALRLERDQQCDQRFRHVGAILDEPL